MNIKLISSIIVVLFVFYACKNKPETTMFTKMSSEYTGVAFENRIDDTTDLTIFDSDLIYSGAGTATADFNNDGLIDIFFIGNQVPSKLYINQGDLKFKDVNSTSGIAPTGWPAGVTVADVNGDGFQDIYICVSGFRQELDKRNLLYINNGDLSFTERAEEYGIDDNGSSNSASFFDYDNDGDLDLFVINYPDNISSTFEISFYLDESRIDTLNCNQLYENVDGVFVNATVKAGIGYRNADSFQCSIGDLNNDGFLDIYVNNDLLQPDFIFINKGNGTFSEEMNKYLSVTPLFSMGSSLADVNNDGLMDIITTEMMPESHLRRKNSMVHPDVEFFSYLLNDHFNSKQQSRNMLQIQNPDGTFSEIGEMAGISRTDWSWAALPCDFDMDGYQDLFITTGVKRDVFNQTYLSLAFGGEEPQVGKYSMEDKELIQNMPVYLPKNYLYKNMGDLSFQEKMEEWGVLDYVASQGASYADLNNDGYPELIVSNTDKPSWIYKNNGREMLNNHILQVSLKGARKNTAGLGAKVRVYSGEHNYYQQLQNSLGFQSCSDQRLFFGLGDKTQIDSLDVIWLGGKMQRIYSVPVDTAITLIEAEADRIFSYDDFYSYKQALFTPLPEADSIFLHRENEFNDFKRDKLLHKKLSREGPGIAVCDVNNDGLEDFFIGGAAGQSGQLYSQTADGKFLPYDSQPWAIDSSFEDMGCLFIDVNNNGYFDLIVASGSNEFSQHDANLHVRLYPNVGGIFQGKEYILETDQLSSHSVVRSVDVNADGYMDLFVGGRMENQTYPSSPQSYLLINKQGKFTDATAAWFPESKGLLGMITDVKFYDFNQNGLLDVIIAGEWMPLQIYEQKNKQFVNQTARYGLESSTGWWNSVALADFNNDGLIDIVGGNFGENSIFKANQDEPITLFYGAYGKTSNKFPVICYYKDGILAPYADRDLWLRSLPSYQNDFLTYEDYGEKSIEDILGEEKLAMSEVFTATELSSCVFINTGDGFEKHKLPKEAQIAPIYGLLTTDFNQDGLVDVLAVGNSYSTGYEEGPMTGMRGQVMLSQGDGSFIALSNQKSGLHLNQDSKALGVIYSAYLDTHLLLVSASNGYLRVFDTQKNMNDLNSACYGYLFNRTVK